MSLIIGVNDMKMLKNTRNAMSIVVLQGEALYDAGGYDDPSYTVIGIFLSIEK